MIQMHSIQEVQNFIQQDGLSILQIASIHCASCASLKGKIEQWAVHYPDIPTAYLEIEEVPEVAGELQIFTAPAVLVFADGKRCIQQVGYFSLDEVLCQIERYKKLIQ